MRTRINIIITMLLFSNMMFAQKPPIKWGKVLSKDTSMRVYAPDPKASAVVLCDYGTVYVGPRTEYNRIVRIKILKEEGIANATVEIPYKYYDRYEEVLGLKAHTINVLPNGKIVKTKLKSNDIKEIQVDRWNKKKVLHFPDVKVGSIIEYSYAIHSLDLVRLRNWYFQTKIPVIWSEYHVNIPRQFNYLVTFQKGRALTYEEQKAFADKLQWLYDTKEREAIRDLIGKKYVLYESSNGTAKVYYAKGESFSFIMNGIPAFEPKQAVMAPTDFYPLVKVHMYLADGNYPFYYRRIIETAKDDYNIEEPSNWYRHRTGYIAYWLPTWDDAVKLWLESDNFGNRLVKAVDFKSIFDKAFSADASEMDKIKGIYQYVKENVKWDGTYSMYSYRDLKMVLRKKSGTSGEMNLLLINLLKKAGVDVQPIVLRTLDKGRPENVYPLHNQFNQVVAMVQAGGQTLFLDASGDNEFGKLPLNVNKSEGFVVTKQNYKWIDVYNAPKQVMQANITQL